MNKTKTIVLLIAMFAQVEYCSLLRRFTQSDCTLEESIFFFSKKALLNVPSPFDKNPYKIKSKEYQNKVDTYLKNSDRVCAIQYLDDLRELYQMKDFETRELAEVDGYIVTHQGRCGACSSLQDLSVYLAKDLTRPVRKCALYTVLSNKIAHKCIEKIGFTSKCAMIWLYNSTNDKSHCFGKCLKSWIKREPNNKSDGELNNCLQCDEDISGPIFKYEAGRTRRDSGIHSEIERPNEQVYDLDQCYF